MLNSTKRDEDIFLKDSIGGNVRKYEGSKCGTIQRITIRKRHEMRKFTLGRTTALSPLKKILNQGQKRLSRSDDATQQAHEMEGKSTENIDERKPVERTRHFLPRFKVGPKPKTPLYPPKCYISAKERRGHLRGEIALRKIEIGIERPINEPKAVRKRKKLTKDEVVRKIFFGHLRGEI